MVRVPIVGVTAFAASGSEPKAPEGTEVPMGSTRASEFPLEPGPSGPEGYAFGVRQRGRWRNGSRGGLKIR